MFKYVVQLGLKEQKRKRKEKRFVKLSASLGYSPRVSLVRNKHKATVVEEHFLAQVISDWVWSNYWDDLKWRLSYDGYDLESRTVHHFKGRRAAK